MKFQESNNLATLNAADGVTPELLRTLAAETDRIIVTGTQRYSRYGLLFDTKYALWAGQNDEGTKEADDAFPWPGANDTRVRLADRIIRERTRLRKAAFWGKRIQPRAIQGSNVPQATLVGELIRWMFYTVALPMMKREVELGSHYSDTYGAAIMGCFWKRSLRLEPQVFDVHAMIQLAQEQPQVGQMLQMMADPLKDDLVAQGLQQQFPDNTLGELKTFLRTLRKKGRAEIRTAYICQNELRWLAMRPGIDVFFEAALDDIQMAPLITTRELLSEADVRAMALDEGWDEEFIEQAVKHKGQTTFDAAIDPLRLSPRGIVGRRGVMAEDMSQRIEILRSFYFAHERGTRALYQTVYHRSVSDVAALHELHTYGHGRLPFFSIRAETAERPIIESRGVPEVVMTWQTEEKVERDAYIDRTSLEIVPTLQVPRGMAGQVLLGPGQQLERKRAGDYDFLTPPPVTHAPISNERRREIAEYYGLFHPEVDPQMTQLTRQETANDFLTDLVPGVEQSWQLMQQYLTDDEIQSVAGPLASGVRLGNRDIQGQYRFEMTFDVKTLDVEYISTITGVIEQLIPMDRMGVIDLSALVEHLMNCISPDLAQRAIRPGQTAQMADVQDEQQQLTMIGMGIEPPLKPVSNAGLRLQVVQQAMQSPRYQQLVAGDPTGIVRKLLENQVQKYQFQLTQQQNANIGRVGVKPVLGGPGDGLPPTGMMGAGMAGMMGGAQ